MVLVSQLHLMQNGYGLVTGISLDVYNLLILQKNSKSVVILVGHSMLLPIINLQSILIIKKSCLEMIGKKFSQLILQTNILIFAMKIILL
jgi:hypothetical protein